MQVKRPLIGVGICGVVLALVWWHGSSGHEKDRSHKDRLTLRIPEVLPREPDSVRVSSDDDSSTEPATAHAADGGTGAAGGDSAADGELRVSWNLRRDLVAAVLGVRGGWAETVAQLRDVLRSEPLHGELVLCNVLDRAFYAGGGRPDDEFIRDIPEVLRGFYDEHREWGKVHSSGEPTLDPFWDRLAGYIESFGRPSHVRRVVLANFTLDPTQETPRFIGGHGYVYPLVMHGLLRRAFEIRQDDPARATRYARAAITLRAAVSPHFTSNVFLDYAPTPVLADAGRWPHLPHEMPTGHDPTSDVRWGVAEVARLASPSDADAAVELERALRLRVVLGAATTFIKNADLFVICDTADQFRLHALGRTDGPDGVGGEMRLTSGQRDAVESAFRRTWAALPHDVPDFVYQTVLDLAQLRELARLAGDRATVDLCERLLVEAGRGVESETTRRWLDEARLDGRSVDISEFGLLPDNRRR